MSDNWIRACAIRQLTFQRFRQTRGFALVFFAEWPPLQNWSESWVMHLKDDTTCLLIPTCSHVPNELAQLSSFSGWGRGAAGGCTTCAYNEEIYSNLCKDTQMIIK